MISIRNLVHGDFDAADEILQSAFGGRGGFRTELDWYLRLQPDGWLIATLDGRRAGIVGAVDYGPFAYIGLLGVHADARGHGVGRALMEHLLRWLDARGCPIGLLDATAAGAPLYRSLGFIEEGESRLFVQPAPRPVAPGSDSVAPMRDADLLALNAFDEPIFGAQRPGVLDELFEAFPERAFITHDGAGRIGGYLLARPQRIGPWAAETPEAAGALLGAALALPFEAPPRVIVPPSNLHAPWLLADTGFEVERTTLHMRRGGVTLPGRRAMLYAQASFAIG
jgi:GNAT superfamily N-acetyltransferase